MRSIGLPEPRVGHAAPITHVAFSPDGALLATSSYDGSAIVWTTSPGAGMSPGVRLRHRRLVNAASWSPQHPGLLATASADKTVGLWRVDGDGSTAEAVGRLARHTDDVNAVAWLPDGERLVTASEDSTALVWEWRTNRFLGKFAAHSGHCMAIAVAPNGFVLSVGEEGQVFVGDVDHPSAAHHREFSTSIEGCAWSPDGSQIALACDDGTVRVLSPELDLLATLRVATSAARSVVFVTDGSGRIIVGSYDASVRVLDGSHLEAEARGGRLWPRSLDSSGDRVVVGSFGSTPVVLSLSGLGVVADGGPDTTGPNAVAVAHGEVAIGLDAGLVVRAPLGSIRTGDPRGSSIVRVGADPVLSIAPAGDGWLAGTYAGAIRRIGADGTVSTGVDLGAPVPSLASHRGGEIVLAGTYGGDVALLSVTSGVHLVDTHAVHDGSVKSITWLDGSRAITGATDCSVRMVTVDGANDVLWNHGNLVNAVSADHRGVIASASRDRIVRAGVMTDARLRTVDLLGGSESMKAVAVLGQGRFAWIVGGSYDFAVYGWELDLSGENPPDSRSGAVLLEAAQAIATIARVDPDTAIVASWDGTIRVLELRDGRPVFGPPVTVDALVAESAVASREESERISAVVA